MPLISVIMSVYNEPEHFLKQSIDSILNQSLRDFELIIVFDCPEKADTKALLNQYVQMDERIKLIVNEKNIGLTASLNKALKWCKGDYIARMDADDINDACRFEKQYQYIVENGLDLVGCEIDRISEEGETIAIRTNRSYPPECIRQCLLLDDCIAHPSWFAKRALYEALQGYRDIYTCEDYDFLLRGRKIGARIGICDAVLFYYRINTKGISRTNACRQQLTAKYLRKHYDRIEELTQCEIDEYVASQIMKKSALRYDDAAAALDRGLGRMKSKDLGGITDIVSALCKSPLILDPLVRVFKLHWIRRQYRKGKNNE